jgi:hypothetical protein
VFLGEINEMFFYSLTKNHIKIIIQIVIYGKSILGLISLHMWRYYYENK